MPLIECRTLRLIAVSAAGLGLLLAGASAGHATEIYDNASSSLDGSDPVGSYGPLADSFTTGAAGFTLRDVRLVLISDSASSPAGIQLNLLSNNANSPGAALLDIGTLADSAVSTASFAVYDFSLAGAYTLAANTTYWLQVESSSAYPTAIEWAWSLDQGALGVAGQYVDNEFGVTADAGYGAYMMVISDVPEPATVTLLAGSVLGIGLIRRRRAT